ncbi:MAG TPA: ABC transporter permease [Vicinamibacterales bacterium]|nr:ABC transporter permease [Vicinamibacterales bacterium]
MKNIRLALRTLFRSPFVTIVAILSLALGIGANAAIFSIFNQMLLDRLPVRQPGELVNLEAPGPKPGSQSCNQAGDCNHVFSYPMFRDLERLHTVFAGVAAHRLFGANLAFGGQTVSGEGVLVSGYYFPLLGLQPAAGRLLNPGDDQRVGESPVVVLAHAYWTARFGQRADIINQQMLVNGQSLTIVGVAPAGFKGTTLGGDPQVFVPITLRGLMEPGFRGFARRQSYWAYVFARLKPGVSIEQAHSGLNVLYRGIINDVEAPLQQGMSEATMKRFREKPINVIPGSQGQSSVRAEAGPPLKMLLAVTALVLFIACANIANLLLARAAKRTGEMAVRLSIGANRWHLIRQLLTESLILAAFGGLAGLVMAKWTLHLIASILPEEATQTFRTELDPMVLAFAAALTVGTGLLFGLFPALHSTRPDLLPTLKGQSGQPSGARGAAMFRWSLATFQIAISITLLIAAGLFVKSLAKVARVELGIKTGNVVLFGISPELNAYTPERSRVLFGRIEETLSGLPGVTSVTSALVPVLSGSNWGTDVTVEGFPRGPDIDSNSRFNMVGPDYFKTLGIPLLAGREFTRQDVLKAPKVAVVNEAFVRKFKLGANPVGKRMTDDGENLDTEIIGLVKDAKYSEVKGQVPPLFFSPYKQNASIGRMVFYVRTATEPEQFLSQIPPAVAALDPNLPLEQLRTLDQQVRENVFLDRFISVMSTAFAVLATLLAAIGLYGVLAYTVSQRTREIGLRMALGAAPSRVRFMVLRQVGTMTVIGGAIGLLASLWIARAAEGILFEMKGRDPAVFAGAALTLAAVALAAGFIPAHRASRVDPMTALRYE